MPLIKRILKSPPIDPAAPSSPLDADGNFIYSNPKYFITNGSVTIDGVNQTSVSHTVNLIQLTKTIQQLSELSLFAQEMFQDLRKASESVGDRMKKAQDRIESLKRILPLVEKKMVSNSITNKLVDRSEWKAPPQMDQQLFSKSTENSMIQKLYEEECFAVPNLSLLDKFREDGQTCMKFYSYPQFFVEQWRALMEKEQNQRKKKKKKGGVEKKVLKVSDVQVKRYNQMGELIVDQAVAETGGRVSPIVEAVPKSASFVPNLEQSTFHLDKPYTLDTLKQLQEEAISMTVAPEVESAPVDLTQQLNEPIVTGVVKPNEEPANLATAFEVMDEVMKTISEKPTVRENTENILDIAITSQEIENIVVFSPPAPPPLPPVISFEENEFVPDEKSPKGVPDSGVTRDSISNAAGNLRKPSVQESSAPPRKDARNEMLSSIKGGGFNLRKVQVQPAKKTSNTSKPGANDVASILMRRIAMEMSDSESSDDDDDGDTSEWA